MVRRFLCLKRIKRVNDKDMRNKIGSMWGLVYCIWYENVNIFGVKEHACLRSRFTQPVGRVELPDPWRITSRPRPSTWTRCWMSLSRTKVSFCVSPQTGVAVVRMLLCNPWAIVKSSDNQPLPSETEPHSQGVIEGMQIGNKTNWIIDFPGECLKQLLVQDKRVVFFFLFFYLHTWCQQ